MTVANATSVAYDLTAYLSEGGKLDATTPMTVRSELSRDVHTAWSFAGPASWEFIGMPRQTSSRDEGFRPLVGPDRPEDVVVAQLSSFRTLQEGWDGEDAARPSDHAVTDAMRFVRSVGATGVALEPTLHVDGSVILEAGEDGESSLRFEGDGVVIYVTPQGIGSAPFDGYAIPTILTPVVRV